MVAILSHQSFSELSRDQPPLFAKIMSLWCFEEIERLIHVTSSVLSSRTC